MVSLDADLDHGLAANAIEGDGILQLSEITVVEPELLV